MLKLLSSECLKPECLDFKTFTVIGVYYFGVQTATFWCLDPKVDILSTVFCVKTLKATTFVELTREDISPFQRIQPQGLTTRRKADKKIANEIKNWILEFGKPFLVFGAPKLMLQATDWCLVLYEIDPLHSLVRA